MAGMTISLPRVWPPPSGWALARAWVRRLTVSDTLVWAAIGLGLVLRLAQYLSDRALWFDEAALALNIASRSYGGLFLPLDNNQGAPVGFLLVQKGVTDVLGYSEYAMRLFPLSCGVVSLFLFPRVARGFVSPRAMPAP